MKHSSLILAGLLVSVIGLGLLWRQARSAGDDPLESPRLSGNFSPLLQKPVYNWRVCADLGVGPVPGTGLRRLRLRLCHSRGWQVLTYCLQPERPAPAIGTVCSRINEDTYWCGNGIQNLREYRVQETPTPTPTPTATGTPAPTVTPTPTTVAPTPTTPTRRARPGGPGLVEWAIHTGSATLRSALRRWFDPALPTPTLEPQETPLPVSSSEFYGIDFSRSDKTIRITIYPPNRRLHRGKPIVIAFRPAQKCRYEDRRACITAFQSQVVGQALLVTVHSGVGGEAQDFRHAMEGTSLGGAAYPLKKVLANLEAWEGAEVVITQGKKRMKGLRLTGLSRVPPRHIESYLEAPIPEAVELAARLDAEFLPAPQPGRPLLIFETCGWKIAGERSTGKVPVTSASIYLGVIQHAP